MNKIELRDRRFAEPAINEVDYKKWLADNKFYAKSEETNLDRYILENYIDIVEQFIGSPESKATKAIFEIATQAVKKYLTEQNV